MNNKLYLLKLNHTPGIGPQRIRLLRERWPCLKDLFELPTNELKSQLPNTLFEAIQKAKMVNIEDDLTWETKPRHRIITDEDKDYPYLLKEIATPPPILYAKGNMDALFKPSIGIVGTRKPTAYGRKNAKTFAYELALKNYVITSGLAMGVDGLAHQGALEANGHTIAVLGTGLQHIYPKCHLNLSEKITENGLVLSEFPLKSPPNARHFPQRNRIISGLSMSILVIEAAIKSGSLITARYALEQNRDIFALPGSLKNPLAAGCHHLLKQGATLVTEPSDIIDALALLTPVPNIQNYRSPDVPYNEILSHMRPGVMHIDEIGQHVNLDISELTSALVTLELSGAIKAVLGGYIRCK